MKSSLRHIALVVPDLQAAEEYYQALFGMKLVGREAELDDGLWYSLPFDRGWHDARTAGIELDMVALRKGEFALALFVGNAPQGQVYAIGLILSREEIDEVRSRLPADTKVETDESGYLEFRDPHQIYWQLSVPGSKFRTAGDFAGRWLEI